MGRRRLRARARRPEEGWQGTISFFPCPFGLIARAAATLMKSCVQSTIFSQ